MPGSFWNTPIRLVRILRLLGIQSPQGKMTDHIAFHSQEKPWILAIESLSKNHICVFANRSPETKTTHKSRIQRLRWTRWEFSHRVEAISTRNCLEFSPCTKTGTKTNRNCTKCSPLQRCGFEWKYYGIECLFDSHVLWSEKFSVLNWTYNHHKGRNRRFFGRNVHISVRFTVEKCYLAPSGRLMRSPEFCFGPQRIIMDKSSLCVCEALLFWPDLEK